MANLNDPRKVDAAKAQKLREQLANQVSELTDEELSSIAGGTTPSAVITAIATAATTEASKSVITGCLPSSPGIPGPVPSPGASTM